MTYTKCRECEGRECKSIRQVEGMDGNAAAGPGKDRPLKDLCQSAVSCMRRTKCTKDGDTMLCYCGTKDVGDCLAGSGDGACRAELEAAAETVRPRCRWASGSEREFYASYYATQLMGCDEAFCKGRLRKGRPARDSPATGGTGGTGVRVRPARVVRVRLAPVAQLAGLMRPRRWRHRG